MLKDLSLRARITLWTGAVLGALILVTYAVFFSVSSAVLTRSLRKELVKTVLSNYDRIEYLPSLSPEDGLFGDILIPYGEGYLRVEDDFLRSVNGISTALYQTDGTLLYGENHIAQAMTEEERRTFQDGKITGKRIDGITWYLYDRVLTGPGLEGLCLRGMTASVQGQVELNSIIRTLLLVLPLLLLLGLPIGALIADTSLRPVRQIIDTAARISEGKDLDRRIGLGEGGDEIHRLARAFDDMFDRLEGAFEEERRFAADASHELRTPVSVIRAQCELALEEEQTQEGYREALRLIDRQSARMAALIEDLLRIARLERGADSFSMEEFDLSLSLEDLCSDMALLRDKDITLTCDLEEGVRIRGNEDLIRRLASNLIANAYRYGREGGWIRVRLRTRAPDRVLLEVEDNGAGISEEDQRKIFLRFYQADRSRTGSGAGLGLSMAVRIAALHGGTLTVRSRRGEGSLFTACLPCGGPGEKK